MSNLKQAIQTETTATQQKMQTEEKAATTYAVSNDKLLVSTPEVRRDIKEEAAILLTTSQPKLKHIRNESQYRPTLQEL